MHYLDECCCFLVDPSTQSYPQLLEHNDRMEQEVFGLTFEIGLKDPATGKFETHPLKVRLDWRRCAEYSVPY